jgi:transglutaminase-like putative cysteine protease
MSFLRFASILIFIFLAGVALYAVPATFSLPPGPRPGIKKLTIQEAAQHLLASGKTGWDLVEAARSMVAERMQYFRRNSFDPAGRAFERGYGYCTQQAYALKHLLNQLGFEARVVQAFQNRFADGKVTAHAWISVRLDGETRQIDSLFYDSQNGELIFTPLSKVTGISPVFKLLALWGGTAVNAHRFYLSGKDF